MTKKKTLNLTNRPVAAKAQGNNPKSKVKAQGNSGNTNTNRIRKATKSNATPAKGGGLFGRFLGR